MARLRTCLDGLPALERRVIVLRAGLGPRRPHSRTGVARELDLSTQRVARVERSGLRRLRGFARGGCGGAAPMVPAGAEPSAPIVFTPAVLSAARMGIGTPRGPGGEPDRVEVKGEQESSLPDGEGAVPELAPPAAARPKLPAAIVGGKGGGTDLTIPLLTLAALLAIAFAARSAIRSQRSSAR